MPIYALAAAAGVIYIAWLALIVHGQIRTRRERHEAAESFMEWMRQERNLRG